VVRVRKAPVTGGVAYTAGLIHDVGKLLIATQRRPRDGDLASGLLAAGGCARERELLGFDHAEAGAALAEHWGLPPALTEPLRHHHDPAAAASETDLVIAVAAADLLAHELAGTAGGGGDAEAITGEDPKAAATGDYRLRLAELGLAHDIVRQLLNELAGDPSAPPLPNGAAV
jgi:hypothetical protein